MALTCHPAITVVGLTLAASLLVTQPGASAHKMKTYTFLQAEQPFLEYHLEWTNARHVRIEFEFRTQKANSFLLHHTLMHAITNEKPQLWATLNQGQLNVTHVYGAYRESLIVAKGLNHDKWHLVSVTLDADGGTLTAAVDSRGSHSLLLEALSENPTIYPNHNTVAIVSAGGFNPEALQRLTHFVGCVRNLRFFSPVSQEELLPPVFAQSGLEAGCVDRCHAANPCQHQGRCINHYTHTSCDCFSTGHEGKLCDKTGMTTVTLHGSEWLSFSLYESNNRVHSPTNRVSLDFKTRMKEGILFYGREQYPQYNHLAVSLHNASLHVSVVFVDQETFSELYVSVGSHLDDDRWHRVVVHHQGHEVLVTLDDELDKMTTDHSHPHLRMPFTVNYGGMESSIDNLGLRSDKNFLGCLRAVYFNHHSVLEQLNGSHCTYHGGPVVYGCQNLRDTCLQLTHSGALAKLQAEEAETFSLRGQFRTLKKDGVIFYADITAAPISGKGFLQISLQDGQLVITILPSLYQPKRKQFKFIGENLSDNEWHSISLLYEENKLHIDLDEFGTSIKPRWQVGIEGTIYLGFGPDTDIEYGFVGCLRRLELQGYTVHPVSLVHSSSSVGISLGGCDLVDWCQDGGPRQCLHGGRCQSDWQGAHCDCKGTPYEGKLCQFSKLKRTCEEYRRAGQRHSGVRQLDLDGSGPLDPVYVMCDMANRINTPDASRLAALTKVDHNLQAETPVRHPGADNIKVMMEYRELNKELLYALVGLSEACQQYVRVSCLSSPLRLGSKTRMLATDTHQFGSIGGDTEGSCNCAKTGSCVDPSQNCNCDANADYWLSDEGYIREPDHLPVTEMIFLQTGGLANLTLGPLECYGSRGEGQDDDVMFLSEESVLEMPPWTGSELQFNFRTMQASAILLYQTSPTAESRHGNEPILSQLLIAVKNEKTLVLEIEQLNVQERLQIPWSMSTGSWQYLSIDIDSEQIRVTVNSYSHILDLSVQDNTEADTSPASGVLYVGAASPSSFEEISLPGVVGCLGGLVYNGNRHHLARSIPDDTSEVVAGCRASCDSNPCQNDAVCQEKWTSFTCHCLDPLAQSGKLCQHNVSNDVVYLRSAETYLLYRDAISVDVEKLFNAESITGSLTTWLVLSFRTIQSDALVLYVHDHLNNFLQIHLQDWDTLILSYNSLGTIYTTNITVPELSDGSWKQVAFQSTPDGAQLLVDNSIKMVDLERELFTNYTETPFENTMGETVKPFRDEEMPKPGYWVYVGGVPGTFTRIPGLRGCMRGVQLVDRWIQLSVKAATIEELAEGCPNGCMDNPCENGGLCIDDEVYSEHYTCDCMHTGYAGKHCHKRDVGVTFDGDSWLVQQIQTIGPANLPHGRHEEISLVFSSNSPPLNKAPLVYLQGQTGLSDYWIVYMNDKGEIKAEVSIKREIVTVSVSGNHALGLRHKILLIRDNKDVKLQVDNAEDKGYLSSSVEADPPALLMVAAVSKDNAQFADYGMYKGHISNVFVQSDQLSTMSARPVDAYLGEVLSPHPVTSQGSGVRPSAQLSSASLMRTGVDPQAQAFSYGGSSGELEEGESSTFPPWNAGPARTVNHLDEDTVGYGSAGGGGVENATAATHNNPFLALVIGGAALLILLVVLVSLLVWARANRHPASTNKPPKDEEEGLLNSAQKGEAHELEPVCTVKLRQGPKAKRPTSKSKRNHDEEETPMLDDEQGIAASPFRRERIEVNRLSTFRSFLLIDDESDDDTTISSPILRGLRGLALSSQTASPEHLPKDAEQLEWDPQIDNTSPGSNLSSPDQHSLPVPLGSVATHPVVRAALQMSTPLPRTLDTPPSQRGSAPREVWTESQILAAMDDEEGEPTWDPIGDSRAQMYDEMIGNRPTGGARNNLNNTEPDEKQHFFPAADNINQNVPLENDVSPRNAPPAALRPTGNGRSLVGDKGHTGSKRLPGAVSPAPDEANDDVYSDAEDVLLDCELNTRLFDSDADSGDETGQLLSGTNSTLTSDDEEGDQPDHSFCEMDPLDYDNMPAAESITIDYRPVGLESIEEEEEEDLANSHNTLNGPAGGKKRRGDQELAGVHNTSVYSSQEDLDCTQSSIHDRKHTTR